MTKLQLVKIVTGFSLSLILAACSTVTTSKQDNDAASTANTQLGLAYLQEGNAVLAKQKLLLALQQAPHAAAAWYAMGYFQQTQGDLKRADYYYRHAVELAPHDGAAQNNYGVFLCRTGHYHEGIAHLLLAANSVKYLRTASAYENAGLCALKIPDRKAASTYFKQALIQNPQRPIAREELSKLTKHQPKHP